MKLLTKIAFLIINYCIRRYIIQKGVYGIEKYIVLSHSNELFFPSTESEADQ